MSSFPLRALTFERHLKKVYIVPLCFPVLQLRWKAAKVSTFRLWRRVLLV